MTREGKSSSSPAAESRSISEPLTSCMASTSTCWSRTIETICSASAFPFFVLSVITRMTVSRGVVCSGTASTASSAMRGAGKKKPTCHTIWQTRQRTVTAESTFRLVNAAIMRTRTLRRASHGMNAAASGMSLPLLRAEGAKRAAMMTTTHAVTAHSSVDIAMRTGERRGRCVEVVLLCAGAGFIIAPALFSDICRYQFIIRIVIV